MLKRFRHEEASWGVSGELWSQSTSISEPLRANLRLEAREEVRGANVTPHRCGRTRVFESRRDPHREGVLADIDETMPTRGDMPGEALGDRDGDEENALKEEAAGEGMRTSDVATCFGGVCNLSWGREGDKALGGVLESFTRGRSL